MHLINSNESAKFSRYFGLFLGSAISGILLIVSYLGFVPWKLELIVAPFLSVVFLQYGEQMLFFLIRRIFKQTAKLERISDNAN